MKWLFKYLLKRYSNTEEGRVLIFKTLHKSILEDYSEQTTFGNIYNLFIEFIMSNQTISDLVVQNEGKYILMIREGINNSYDEAVKYIEDEDPRMLKNKRNKKINQILNG